MGGGVEDAVCTWPTGLAVAEGHSRSIPPGWFESIFLTSSVVRRRLPTESYYSSIDSRRPLHSFVTSGGKKSHTQHRQR